MFGFRTHLLKFLSPERLKSEHAEIRTWKSSNFGVFPISGVGILAFHYSNLFEQEEEVSGKKQELESLKEEEKNLLEEIKKTERELQKFEQNLNIAQELRREVSHQSIVFLLKGCHPICTDLKYVYICTTYLYHNAYS